MRLKLPARATSFGFDGINYEPDDQGFVEVPDHALSEARRHGLQTEDEAAQESLIAAKPKFDQDILLMEIAALKKENADLKIKAASQDNAIGSLRAQLFEAGTNKGLGKTLSGKGGKKL